MKKNVAGQKIGAQLVSATDGSAFTGSVTVSVTIDAGTQATGSVGSGACTHEGNGYHTYAPAQAETNGDLVAFTFTGTGAVPVTVQVYTRPTTGLLAPTVADRTLDVTATGAAGIDWANVENQSTSVSLSATTVATVTTTTTATNVTTVNGLAANVITAAATAADFGTEVGTAVWATAARTLTAATNITSTGASVPITAGGLVSADVTAISTDTVAANNAESFFDGTGYAGTNNVIPTVTTVTNLTNAPTSGDLTATMKASINTEVDTALADIRLDELLAADSDIDGAAPPTVGSVFHELMTKTTGSFTYDQTTDSLEALRDRGDSAWITATGFSTHSAGDVWDVTLASHLTAGSTGNALNAAGSAGDPWSTTLPGAYGAGSAGYIVGNNLNATVSSRSSHSAADVWAVATRVLTAATNITSTGGSVPITAGGLVSSDVTAISTDTTAANNCESFFDGTGYAGTNNVIPTVTNVTTVNGLAAGVITTASIADNAITTGKIDVTAYDTMASTVWEDSVALHTTPGTFGSGFATITTIDGKVDTIDTVVDAIKVKTDYLPSATAGSAGGVFIAGSNAATTVNFTGNLSGSVGSVTGAVGSVTGAVGSVTATVSADVVSISGDSVAADNLESYLDGTNFMPVDAHKPIFSISGATLTVKKPDGTTTAYTRTLTTDAAAEPVTGSS